MLGSEYNWLISFTRPPNGVPKVSLARSGMLTLVVALFCFFCVVLHADPSPQQLMSDAGAALQSGDNLLFVSKLEAARTLRPDYPRALYLLARGYAASGRAVEAVAQLRELAAMGLSFDVTADAKLAALSANADFIAVTKLFAANQNPTGHGVARVAFAGADGILEGLAIRANGQDWYFGDVHDRCVWRHDAGHPGGTVTKFSSDLDQLDGVFGLKLDEAHRSLWAGTAALPEMKGYTAADKGRSTLVELDLNTGRLRHSYAIAPDGREHVLGDVLLAADGAVYASDSSAPVIWRLAPQGTRLEKWVENAEFVSLQGLAFVAEGRALIVADYASGLWRIDVASRQASLLAAPAHTTLFGIDGLYAVSGGLIGIQNGINPQRVIRIQFDVSQQVSAIKVLLASLPAMSDVTLGQPVGDQFYFIGNAGWSLYENPASTPAPRDVTILSTSI